MSLTLEQAIDCFDSQEKYKRLMSLKNNLQSDQASVLIRAIELTITSNVVPIRVLLALRLAKELVEIHNQEMVLQIQDKVLPYVFEFAKFDFENKDPDRGKALYKSSDKYQYINSRDQQKVANSIIWAAWYPLQNGKQTQFAAKYEQQTSRYKQLLAMEVSFPKLLFFNVDDVKEVYDLQCISQQSLPVEKEIEKWNQQCTKLKQKLINISSIKGDKGKYILQVEKIALHFKAFEERAKDIQELQSWLNFASVFSQTLQKLRSNQMSLKQFKLAWQNYEESFVLNQETGHSSSQQILTQSTFEVLVKEKDALIKKLHTDRLRLYKKLEQCKIELYQLQSKKSESNHLLHVKGTAHIQPIDAEL